MKKSNKLDLKVLLLVSLIVLSMAACSLLVFKRLAHQAENLLFAAMEAMSHAVHHAIAGQFYERYYDAQAFARNPDVQSMQPLRVTAALNAYVKLYEIYDLILVTDVSGRLIASNTIDARGQPLDTKSLLTGDFSRDIWFQAAIRGQWTEQVEKNLKGSFVESPGPDPYLQSLGREGITNSFATVIRDEDGKILGTLCNRAGVRWIEREFQNAYDMFQAGGFSGTRLELISATGDSLVQPLSRHEALAPPPAAEHSWIRSTDVLVGAARITDPKFPESLGWGVRITTPASTASQNLRSTVRLSYALIFLATGTVMILGIGYMRRLVIARYLRDEVALRTEELHAIADDLELRNAQLEDSKRELMETNHQLITAQKELLETAKRLGQSEVAALTLHNIGNIVTSLNIQSTLLREHLDFEEPGHYALLYLKKIQEQGINRELFPGHLQRIEEAEGTSVENVRNLIRGLIDNVRMAMSAITSQVSFIQHTEPSEDSQMSGLVQNTLALYDGTFRRHRLQLCIELQHDAIFSTERFRFESVLTVLIRNAIDATLGSADRRLRFYTGLDESHLILSIEDNGSGFNEDVAGKLFRFGFSTKDKGHGFGLHYAANSCKHLGFQLKLESPGEGRGATASLLIPRESLLSVSLKG